MVTEPDPKPKRTAFIEQVSDAVVDKMRDIWSEMRELIQAEPPTPTVNTPQSPPQQGTIQETGTAHHSTPTPETTPTPQPEPEPPTIPPASPPSEHRQRSGFNILR